MNNYEVINRKFKKEKFDINKIKKLILNMLNKKPIIKLNINNLIDNISKGLVNNMKTTQINEYISDVCENMILEDYNYSTLGARITTYNLIRNIKNRYPTFSSVSENNNYLFRNNYLKFIKENKKFLNKLINEKNNYKYDKIGIFTLIKSYLLIDTKSELIETPQYMLLRVAVNLWCDNKNKSLKYCKNKIIETYNAMSEFKYTHATPTLFNSGLKNNCLISCYLQQLPEDSIDGIYESFKRTAKLQKSAGGVATHIHNLRSKYTNISTSNKQCDGILKVLKQYELTAQYVDQNKKRPGANAIYMEVWHYQILDFIDMSNPFTPKELSATDLFYAIYSNDLFFKCVLEDDYWYLMCPHKYPNLSEVYGESFEKLYTNYIELGKINKKIVEIKSRDEFGKIKHVDGQIIKLKAKIIMEEILKSMIESGKPYILNKDQINLKSSQKNLGTIKSSNLCCEITLFSDEKETATCCLSSIKISEFYNYEKKEFDWKELKNIVEINVENLNRVLEVNVFPTEQTKLSNSLHAPIGIGIQDLASLFMKMKIPYNSEKAREMAEKIQEFIYFHALSKSCLIAKENNKYYKSFKGSPASFGELQFHMWNKTPNKNIDWDNLIKDIQIYGLVNSTVLANMPTASTSFILGSGVESFTPMVSNLYTRKVKSGEFVIINKYLVDDLKKIGLWNKELAELISKENDGKIGNIKKIPLEIRKLYSTVYEFGNKSYIDLVSNMAPFVDQSFSMNIYPMKADTQDIYNIIMYGVEKKLKTLCYYTRTDPASKAIVNKKINKNISKNISKKKWVCNNDDECTMCGS
jgi:ribonucleoside-diphosphate reductase subunit M1